MNTNIYNALQDVTLKSVNGIGFNVVKAEDQTSDSYIASLEVVKSYGDVKVKVIVHTYGEELEYSYRTGVIFNDSLDNEFTVEELAEELDLSNYSEKMNKGICAIQKRNILKFVDKVLAELIPQLEEILEDPSELSVVKGVKANSNDVYKTVEELEEDEITNAENEAFQSELDEEDEGEYDEDDFDDEDNEAIDDLLNL